MKKSFCFLSKKGGVGKTTFALNCAHALAFSNFRTLLVDIDGQANLTKHLMGAPSKGGLDISHVLLRRASLEDAVQPTGYENLDLLSGSVGLEDLPLFDPRLIREPSRLKSLLQPALDGYDYVLIDCPPAINWLTRMVLFTVESVIVPIQAEAYALQGLFDLVPMLDRMTATAQLYKVVVNMFRSNTQLHQGVLKEIEEAFPGRVARQKVRQTIQMAEAAKEGLSIFEYAPTCTGALDLYNLCWELFELSPERVRIAKRSAVPEPAAQAAMPAALGEPVAG